MRDCELAHAGNIPRPCRGANSLRAQCPTGVRKDMAPIVSNWQSVWRPVQAVAVLQSWPGGGKGLSGRGDLGMRSQQQHLIAALDFFVWSGVDKIGSAPLD